MSSAPNSVSPEGVEHKTYRGMRILGERGVSVNGFTLDPAPSRRVHALAPAFDWGSTPGAFQLALAILLDVTGSAETALDHCRDFRRQFVSQWVDDWEITDAQVRDWLSLGRTRAEE